MIVLILYLLSSNVLHFNSNNVLEFLKYYNNFCNNFHLSNKEKICCLFNYYKFQINLYIKIISKWKKIINDLRMNSKICFKEI